MMNHPNYVSTPTMRITGVVVAPDAHADKLRQSLAWHADGIKNALNLYARGTGNATAALVARMIQAALLVWRGKGE